MRSLVTSVALAVALCGQGAADLRPGAPFADGMVLQRDRSVPVWGEGRPGAVVTVDFAGQTAKAQVGTNGTWRVDLQPMAMSKTGRAMRISDGESVVSINDVLVGEVWLASGQSNMDVPIVGEEIRYRDRTGALEVQLTRRPAVRMVKVARKQSTTPVDAPRAKWWPMTPEATEAMSQAAGAIAWYFARGLNEALDVPVGIVDASVGGSHIISWLPQGGIYWHGMVEPFAPMAARGLIWYQGCRNYNEPEHYVGWMHELYGGWAGRFENPEMSLHYVQIAGFAPCDFFRLQLAQAQFEREEPHATMTVSCDTSNPVDCHPWDKEIVARRLLAQALRKDYGLNGIRIAHPRVVGAEARDDALALKVENGEGMYVYSPDRNCDAQFELVGADGVWRAAKPVNVRPQNAKDKMQGVFDGADIVLKAAGVDRPLGARYLARPGAVGTVFNGTGLPFGPFEAFVEEAGQTVVVPRSDCGKCNRRIAGGIDWIDGRELPLEGRAFDDVAEPYDRLPANVTTAVCDNVRTLLHHTSGMQFRFTTTSPTLWFRWTPYHEKDAGHIPGAILNALAMAHMPASGVSGIDLYTQDKDGGWRFFTSGAVYPGVDSNVSTGCLNNVAVAPGTPICVNLPLYNGLRSFELGVLPGAEVQPLPKRKSGIEKPVVFYGTSITQGACASRPGLGFVNVVGRELDVPVVNLGFSGGGQMELEMSEHLARIDASCYVLDALWNMNPPAVVQERYEPFVRNLRRLRPGVPIVMAEQSCLKYPGRNAKDSIMRALYEKLVAEGWTKLVYLPKGEMYADFESTVDGIHPNDLGMRTMAVAFGKAVREALEL